MKYDIFIKDHCVDNEKEIKGFVGKHEFLSNFFSCDIWFEGQHYASSENAYQAAKLHPKDRINLAVVSPAKSKILWKDYPSMYVSPDHWDNSKYDIMTRILFEKFSNLNLRERLLMTKNKYLEETNFWGDSYWGIDVIKGGQNKLGEILMKIRKFWI